MLAYENRTIGGGEFGVLFFDNQFVATAVLFGLVGLGLLIACFVVGVAAGGSNALNAGELAALAVLGFSFDFLDYLTPALIFGILISIRLRRLRPQSEPTLGRELGLEGHPTPTGAIDHVGGIRA